MVSSGITTQHTSVSAARGNLTSVSQWLNTTNSWITTATNTYFDTGMINVAKDAKLNPTTYAYSSTYAGAYPTTVTNALSQQTTYTYDINSGQVSSVEDPNQRTTNYTYDTMMRPSSVTYPDGGYTGYNYFPYPYNGGSAVQKAQIVSSGVWRYSTLWFDTLGRPNETTLTSDPEGTDYTSYATYDSLGRVHLQYNPTRCNPPTTSCGENTWGYTTYAYDALGRATSVTLQDGSVNSTSYSGNCATATDPAGISKKTCNDALGRLTEVIENPGGLNYVTTYSYDALGDLTGVLQNGSHQRTFVYDSLGRLTSATNPENATTTYAYDDDGNVTGRTDARGITTTYTYDALNRLTEKTYSDSTVPAHFYYDSEPSWWDGFAPANPIGRLVADGTSANLSTWPSAEWFSYDAMGRVVSNSVWQLDTGTVHYPTYSYNLAGDLISETDAAGIVNGYNVDAAGYVRSITSNAGPATLATIDASAGYSPTGGLQLIHLANGLTETTVIEPRLQPCRIELNNSGLPDTSCIDSLPSGTIQSFQLVFGSWGTTNNGAVTQFIGTGAQNFNRSYSSDALNRLSAMSAPGDQCTGLSWTYDAWGNRTDQTATGGTCNTFHQSVDSNNHLLGPTYQYDAAGNLTYDGVHTYYYDAEDRLYQVDGSAGRCYTGQGTASTACYTYDANGRRVQTLNTGGAFDSFYDIFGNLDAMWSIIPGYNGWKAQWAYLGNQRIAVYASSTAFFPMTDHLGSNRIVTDMSGNIGQCTDYYPFGEETNCNSNGDFGGVFYFTGQQHDFESNLDYFMARHYSSAQGRFMQPDPSGLYFADPTAPQTLNRYAYVRNSPLEMTDPSGLDGQPAGCDIPDECVADPYCGLMGCWNPSDFAPDFPTVSNVTNFSPPPTTGLPPGIFSNGPGVDYSWLGLLQWAGLVAPNCSTEFGINGCFLDNNDGSATCGELPCDNYNNVDFQFTQYKGCVGAATAVLDKRMARTADYADQIDQEHPGPPPAVEPGDPAPYGGAWRDTNLPGYVLLVGGIWNSHEYNNAVAACGKRWPLAALHP